MLSTMMVTSSSVSGGRQRTSFQANKNSSATSGSIKRRSKCPARRVIVSLRAPSPTPPRTRSRQLSAVAAPLLVFVAACWCGELG